jgi:nitrogen-specific signal transduction histidine kinase/HD-like signal output (HDOD) protein
MQQIPITVRDEIESINFPSIPHVLLRFLAVVEDERASVAALATLVGQDPALSARFLTVANSAALRRGKEVTSLEQCMVTLGTRLARTLAACLAIQNVFARAAGEVQYDFRGFWRHSLRVAEMSRAIAAKKSGVDGEEAYLAGLMHDVGLLLLLGSEGERYGDLLKWSIDESVLSDIEKPMIGTDHATVGAWLIEHWKLSSFMSDAILFHHKTPDEIAAADSLSQIVWSSHIICSYHETLDLTRMEHSPDLTAVTSLLGLDMSTVASMRDQTTSQIDLLAEALGVTESADSRVLPSPVTAPETGKSAQKGADPVFTQLDDAVRDIAVLNSLQQNLSSFGNEEDLFIAIKESARILFGLGRIALLLVNPDSSRLASANFSGQSLLLQRLEIKLDTASSLVAAVASGNALCSTFDTELPAAVSLVDVQITRILGGEGVLYVPMHSNDRLIGVMMYGISVLQHARIQKRLPWISRFAGLAATSIAAWQEMSATEKSIEARVTGAFELKARRIVHEAGNPLSIIKNYLKIVTQKIPDDQNVHQELEILRDEIDRVSTILQRLNASNEPAPITGTVDINKVIEGMLSLYGESLFTASAITVEKNLDPALAPIGGDRDSIKQILLNIWKNAADAMAPGGRIGISTKDNVAENGRTFVEVVLSDSGPGLPPDVMRRLFQQLEPDRRPGHSGIGLSIVAALVEHLGGTITCRSSAEEGTTFRILLPRRSGKSS